MSSKRGGLSSIKTGRGGAPGSISSPNGNQLQQDLSAMDLQSADGWEVSGRRNKNKAVSNSNQWASQSSSTKARGHSNTVQRLGMRHPGGSGRGYTQASPVVQYSDASRATGRGRSNAVGPSPVIPAPLNQGWNWAAKTAGTQGNTQTVQNADDGAHKFDDPEDGDESDALSDTDNDLLSDEFDSDGSPKTHEARKQNRWFRDFFKCLDEITVEQINETERQWHCPACEGGPGAIDWYRGLIPLITHAKTKRSKRTKLHREFAFLLEEELKLRGSSAAPANEMFGKWKGLDERADREIVWPPMVIVMNTRLEKDDNDKWLGMGNLELLDYFSSYAASRARHSYGPMGHRGMSVLIFEASAVGYAEAERLNRHFEDTCRDRNAWNRIRMPTYSGGQRQLYGYMAEQADIEIFNKHAQGKSKLKYDMRSYQEMVVNQMKQMSEDNQKLNWYKSKAVKEQMSKLAAESTMGAMSEKLRQAAEENRIVKLRSQKHHEQNKQEMDFQEEFFTEQIQKLYESRNVKEGVLEKSLQTERDKIFLSESTASSAEERQVKELEIAKFIQVQNDKVDEYRKKKDTLIKSQEERKLEMQRRHHEEMMALEKQLDEEFTKLIEEYSRQTNT